MKKLSSIFILLLFVLVASCSKPDRKAELESLKKQQSELKEKISKLEAEIQKSGDGRKEAVHDVSVTTLQAGSFRHLIEVQARIESDENVMVSPELPGTLSKIMVKVGDKVNAGTVLARLEDQVYQKSLEELGSAREFAQTLYLKQKSLWDQKIGTEIQFLQAKNNLESIDRKIATVRQQLEMTRIKSPVSGTVDQVDIKAGMAFSPGMPGLRVVNFSKLKVQAEVAEAYISKTRKGDPVEVFLPDLNRRLSAMITYTGKVIDPLNRTFRVEVDMRGKDEMLHPNQVAVLRITDYQSDQAIVLPLGVVQTTPEGSYVFLSENGKARKQTVTPGLNYDGKVEIRTGLKAGDQVITSGYQDLVDGELIRIANL